MPHSQTGSRPRPPIRRKLIGYLAFFVLFILAVLWCCQILLLNHFYRWHKANDITAAASALYDNIDNEDFEALAGRIAERFNLCVMVVNDSYEPQLSIDGATGCMLHRLRGDGLRRWFEHAPEDGSGLTETLNTSAESNYDPGHFRGRVPERQTGKKEDLIYIRCVTREDGSVVCLMLNTVVTPLDATVSTLRFQLIIITLVILAIATLLGWIVARQFSRPIIETSQAAADLAKASYTRPPHAGAYREIDELNDTLEAAARELGQVEHLKNELIANVSHDLRTPLTMISGYAEVMRDIPDEFTPENLQAIIDESARLSSLVNELLDFSRLQAGAPMDPALFCLTDAIRSIVERCGTMVAPKGYRILFEPDCDVAVVADERRIGQVLYNLINNAMTYTGDDHLVTIRQLIRGEIVRVQIIDTGAGIPADELPLIWNRYYRAKENHRRAIQGSGLGLSIVQTILEAHQAKYGVESEEGQGTTFWFELKMDE